MPNRILREGILDSGAVNSLTWPSELFYRKLMSVVDDFGLFDGRLEVLRSRLYALQLDRVRVADVASWIAECEKAGLIRTYTVDSKPYILFHKLGPQRAKRSKYPRPPDGPPLIDGLRADESRCAQTRANVTDPEYEYVGAIDFGFGVGGSRGEGSGQSPPESVLARQWLMMHRGPKLRGTDLESIMQVIAELLRQGTPQSEIEARINDKNRRRTETIWEFEKHWGKHGNHHRAGNAQRRSDRYREPADETAANE